MAKIAIESRQQAPSARQLAAGRGWTISDVTCTAGPQDAPFEEQHSRVSIAAVLNGSFEYRSSSGSELMTPGSLLLGNAGDCFSCAHEHGVGDRCVAFHYEPEWWERIVSGAGAARCRFRTARIPPIPELARVAVKCMALQSGDGRVAAGEFNVELAAIAARIASGAAPAQSMGESSAILSRVSRVVRMIENEPGAPQGLDDLARCAGLSPYHFLRVFQEVTGTTPHQYVLRGRLRKAAFRLRTESAKILEIALDGGFGDVSNFNRAFRSEFGISPREWRKG